jgi:hypothetical protein
MAAGAWRIRAFGAMAALTAMVACSDDVGPPASSGQQGSTTSGHPRVYGVWDVSLVTRNVPRGTADTNTVACGGRLEIDVQRDSLFSGTMILRDTCAQFGGIDGVLTRNGVITRLTFTITVGIGFCEVIGDPHFMGTVSGRSIEVHAANARQCEDGISDRELTLTGERR